MLEQGQTFSRTYRLFGQTIVIHDFRISQASDIIFRELKDGLYGIDKIDFKPGDIVVDIGAHIGFFSILLARLYPEITIYAVEPVFDNYRHAQMNLEANQVTTVKLINRAISTDPEVHLIMNPINSGGALQPKFICDRLFPNHQHYRAKAMTLEQLFQEEKIQQCKLLKLDCEGAEYEMILQSSILSRVQYLAAEIHTNQKLVEQGYSPEKLRQYCLEYIPQKQLFLSLCQMAE